MDRRGDILDGGYSELACAIAEQAAIDYYEARFFLDTLDERYIRIPKRKTREEMLEDLRRQYEETVDECEGFFLSFWFETLTGLDGDRALEGIEETYRNEIYDKMYETFLENE